MAEFTECDDAEFVMLRLANLTNDVRTTYVSVSSKNRTKLHMCNKFGKALHVGSSKSCEDGKRIHCITFVAVLSPLSGIYPITI